MTINKARKTHTLLAIKGLCTPAGGCTEIGAIGYCVAAAAQQVNGDIEKVQHIVVKVSPYIFKNVMHVGVPNLGTCGITMIAAAAAAIKDPTDKLELYKNVTSNVKAIARRLIDNRIVSILIAKDSDPVYVKTKIISKDRKIEALVQTNHDNLAYVKVNGDVIYGSKQSRKNKNKTRRKVSIENISIEHLFDIVNCFKKEELHFLEKLFKMN
ncbi:MAG: hypothetical protein K2M43_02365 [Mycoplasmoidaceae bacterium]|nr:hypothetical protein [Mycoplasmoidaceae bacterium]